jgi:hypothetical protein
MTHRSVRSLHPGRPTRDGNGVPLRRFFPAHGLLDLDPFLLLDHFGPLVLPPGSDAGFPPHPHKGFQTLTYLLQGAFAHRDSTGGQGLLRPGGAQLMTAGRGIVHEEMPVPEHLETGGPIEGLQLWINLPRAQKLLPPGYQDLQPDTIPEVAFPDGVLRALAGSWLGVEGPARTVHPVAYAHLRLGAGASFEHPLESDWNGAVVCLHGELRCEGAVIPEGQLAVLGRGSALRLEADQDAEALVLGGAPLGEPVARHGPFVMSTEAELQEAVWEYQTGRMGSL